MAQSIIERLSQQHGIDIRSPEQLKNGNILMSIALKVLYHGSNTFIETKLAEAQNTNKSISPSANTNKMGNNVIILNSLLKHIKTDPKLHKQTWLKQLTFYNLLENQASLHNFVNWMIDHNNQQHEQKQKSYQESRDCENQQEKDTLPLKHKKASAQNFYQSMTEEEINSMSSNRFRNVQTQNPRFKTEEHEPQNDFENLYFASNLKNKPNQQEVKISPEKGDKIVRKGSFKLLKPKVTFTDDSTASQPKELPQMPKNSKSYNLKNSFTENQTSKLSNFYEPDELKEISMIEPSNNYQQQNMSQNMSRHQNSEHENFSQIYEHFEQVPSKKLIQETPLLVGKQASQIENRKTIPKNLSKPPLCRSSSRKNKENYQSGPSDKEMTVQQQLKKKNFFNFSQNEDIVSTFNYELVDSKEKKVKENSINMAIEISGQTSRSKVFSRIKDLQNGQNKNHFSESSESSKKNIIEETEYNVLENSKIGNKISARKSFEDPNESSAKLLKLKNHFLQKQLYNLENEISQEQSSLHQIQQYESEQSNQNQTNYNPHHKRSTSGLNIQNKQISQLTGNKKASFDSVKKSNRKVFKVNLTDLQEKDKQSIIDWLDSLHYVDKTKLATFQEIFEKFKDGTRFVELCNHYIGRGKPLPYFNNPKKNAEIHSNFSKVFDYLKSFSQWDHPELLFAFELFVPYPQENSIWNLLFGMFKLLTKKGKASGIKTASKQESLILTKEFESSRKKSVQKQFDALEINKESQRQDPAPKTLDFNSNGNKNHQQTSKKPFSSSSKQSNFTKPIEFVREIPENLKHNDLVQQSEEFQSCPGSDQNARQNEVNMNVYFEGYKDRYMRKTLQNSSSKEKSKCTSMETPKKIFSNEPNQHEQSFIFPYGQTMNKGSVKKSSSKKMLQNQLKKMENSSCKLLSAKKSQRQSQRTKQMPKISLNMQMKVEKLLKHFGLHKFIDENSQKLVKFQLLEDPIRNGTLINMLLGKFVTGFEGKYIQPTRSIEHCRQNYMNFYGIIKNKYGQEGFEMVEKYLDFTEDILKGEKTLFYGIAYALNQLMEKKGFRMDEGYQSSRADSQVTGTYRAQKEKGEQIIEMFCRNHIEWVRFLERKNEKIAEFKIRTEEQLRRSVYSGLFLYGFSENKSFKPIYMKPCNNEEREANLKKIICFLVQNKMGLEKEDFYNVKSIVKYDGSVMNGVIQKMIRYSVEKYGVGAYHHNQNGNMGMKNDENHNQMNSNRMETVKVLTEGCKTIALGKYLQESTQYGEKHFGNRLQTTADYINDTYHQNERSQQNHKHYPQKHQQEQTPEVQVQVPWMRKLGFTNCSLAINNGLISKLTRTNIKFNENISPDSIISKPQSLANIRKAIKLIPSFKFDQMDIYQADSIKTLQVYETIKEKFKNTYEFINSNHK